MSEPSAERGRFLPALLWISTALVLLGLLFGALAAVAYGYATSDHAAARYDRPDQLLMGLLVYVRVVFAKGLAPGLLIALASWPLWARFAAGERNPAHRAGGLWLAASLGFAFCAPVLLTQKTPILETALKIEGLGNWIASYLLMTGTVWFCLWLPRRLFSSLAPGAFGPRTAPTAE